MFQLPSRRRIAMISGDRSISTGKIEIPAASIKT